ncbi:MAG TPA: DUF4279 domain-containing protein [Stellaceae bacterium]|jgi:hypothetical protein|nr:DUF4279 domain-containing protein [Stellaceae bacterium]
MAAQATTQRQEGQAAGVVETVADRGARFDIALLIRHPNLDPALITERLGLDALRAWKAGDARTTPAGRLLPGRHADSCWNYVFHYKDTDRLSMAIEDILGTLKNHKPLLEEIDKTGGTTELFLELPGDANIGDGLSWVVLKKFATLKIGLSVETFPGLP